MPKVAIKLYNREYAVNCDDGQEGRLKELVGYLEEKMQVVSDKVGNTTETRLLMLTCLSLADELLEIRRTASSKSMENEGLLIAAVEHLRDRVSQIAAQVGRP